MPSIFDPLAPFDFAVEPFSDLDTATPSIQRLGFIANTPPGTGVVNSMLKTFMEALLKFDAALSDATITVPISPILGGWSVPIGTLGTEWPAVGLVFPGGVAPQQTVILKNIGELCSLNAAGRLVSGVPMDTEWFLTDVKMTYDYKPALGTLLVKIKDRPLGSIGGWSSTSLTFPTTAGVETNTDSLNKSILATSEYALEIDMTTSTASDDISIIAVVLTFKRNGIP